MRARAIPSFARVAAIARFQLQQERSASSVVIKSVYRPECIEEVGLSAEY